MDCPRLVHYEALLDLVYYNIVKYAKIQKSVQTASHGSLGAAIAVANIGGPECGLGTMAVSFSATVDTNTMHMEILNRSLPKQVQPPAPRSLQIERGSMYEGDV